MQNNETLRQANAFAMQDGIVLGLWGIATMWVFKGSFSVPFFSSLFAAMFLCSPVVAALQTLRYRRAVAGKEGSFAFSRGFLHALLTGFYASVWVAIAIFVYLQYFDHGRLFAAYAQSLNAPQVQAYFQQSGMAASIDAISGGRGAEGLADAMQAVGAANYAALSLYAALLLGPAISAVIGWVARRG